MKKITILLFILFSLHAVAQVGTSFTTGGIKYKITAATTVEVSTNSSDITGTIIIPESVSYNSSNYQVTSIGNAAFRSCTGLTSIIIPNLVTSIGNDTFRGCNALTSINIPNSVTNIGSYAFSSCIGLTSVTIPNMVTTINEGLFDGCINLTSVSISNLVTNIGSYAFSSCENLSSVTIPNSVTIIGYSAFSSCSALTSINIPNSVTSIGDLTFKDCISLSILSVNWTNPLAINSSVFTGLTLSTVSLNVPLDTAIAYKTALVWKEFYSISEPVGQIQLGQKFAVNGINYFVRKATLPY